MEAALTIYCGFSRFVVCRFFVALLFTLSCNLLDMLNQLLNAQESKRPVVKYLNTYQCLVFTREAYFLGGTARGILRSQNFNRVNVASLKVKVNPGLSTVDRLIRHSFLFLLLLRFYENKTHFSSLIVSCLFSSL